MNSATFKRNKITFNEDFKNFNVRTYMATKMRGYKIIYARISIKK